VDGYLGRTTQSQSQCNGASRIWQQHQSQAPPANNNKSRGSTGQPKQTWFSRSRRSSASASCTCEMQHRPAQMSEASSAWVLVDRQVNRQRNEERSQPEASGKISEARMLVGAFCKSNDVTSARMDTAKATRTCRSFSNMRSECMLARFSICRRKQSRSNSARQAGNVQDAEFEAQ
jgi:hypothetical protein